MRRCLSCSLLSLILLPGLALAAEQAPVIVVCDGEDPAIALTLEEELSGALRSRGREVKDLDLALGRRDPTDDVNALLDEAMKAFELLETDLARESLDTAEAVAAKALNAVKPRLLAQISVVRAAIAYSEGDDETGLRAIQKALNMLPTLEAGEPLPKAGRQAMRDLADEIAFQTPGKLDVKAPAGAQVWMDGVERGVGDTLVSALSPGPHMLMVRRSGRGAVTKNIEIAEGKTARVAIKALQLDDTLKELTSASKKGEAELVASFAEAAGTDVLACYVGERVNFVRTEAGVGKAGEVPYGAPRLVATAIFGEPGIAQAPAEGEPFDAGPILLWTGVSAGVLATAAAVVGLGFGIAAAIPPPVDDTGAIRREQGASAARQVVLGF